MDGGGDLSSLKKKTQNTEHEVEDDFFLPHLQQNMVDKYELA